nr:MAG TPA: hypothetical protein [Caudoviricetes sp.]
MLTHQGRMGLAPTTFTSHSEISKHTYSINHFYE